MSELLNRTLGSLLSEPAIAPIAPCAVKGMDLTKEPAWGKTLQQLRDEHFGGSMADGFARLFRAAETGAWYYPLYTPEETAADERKQGANLVWLPSDDPKADERPFVLIIPGGGFVNVWNMTEGWPIAEQLNKGGLHCFVLSYQLGWVHGILEREMDDISRALDLIRGKAGAFHVDPDRYVTLGFSAGGYITCLWSTREKGWAAHGQPRPVGMVPVYSLVSLKLQEEKGGEAADFFTELVDCSLHEATQMAYEIPDHADCFPPCAIFLASQDTLVPPEHSERLRDALLKAGIPVRFEMGPEGGHGFGDGAGMCMAGWTSRAAAWIKAL